MNTLRAISHMMRADYLERIRRISFLITLAIGILAVSLCLPTHDASYSIFAYREPLHVAIQGGAPGTVSFPTLVWYRGVYNSAWIGMVVALLATFWLGLIGFYLVKNTVERDMRTGVGQVLATTPLNRVQYTLGKTLSNFAFLTSMVVVMIVAAAVIQLQRGEDLCIDLWMLVSPFLFLTLPILALISALAVLFETIAWLRAGLGNIVYFFLWIFSITASVRIAQPAFDLLGVGAIYQQMNAAIKVAAPTFTGQASIAGTQVNTPPHTFVWQGIAWTGDLLTTRLIWAVIALVIASGAAIFFSRFDPARDRRWKFSRATTSVQSSSEQEVSTAPPVVSLTPLPTRPHRLYLSRVLIGEARLMLLNAPRWWYLIAAGLVLATLFTPLSVAYDYLFPIAWLWPLLLWSPLGNREKRYQVDQLIFSVARPVTGQLPVQWLTGVLLALLTASEIIARLALIGDGPGLLALLVGALFIASLALAAGVWTGNSRLFEVVYLILWYAGPINHLAPLDYTGVTESVLKMQMLGVYTVAALLLLILAFLGRQRQLRG